MKTFLAIISAMNAKLTVLTDKSAALKKQPKPTPVKEDKPDTEDQAQRNY